MTRLPLPHSRALTHLEVFVVCSACCRYTYSKMSPVHIDFVARRLEHKGYTVRYDARGFAWAWHTNVNHVHAATRPVPHPLKPGISRVEGPVPVYGRHLTAPVWRAAAPGAESYIMQGAWQRSYCFYVVFDAPRVVTHVRVEFGPGTWEVCGRRCVVAGVCVMGVGGNLVLSRCCRHARVQSFSPPA